MAALRRWAISAAGAAGLAALVRRRRARGPGGTSPASPAEDPAALAPPPAAGPLGADAARAIDAARERLRREAEGRREDAPG